MIEVRLCVLPFPARDSFLVVGLPALRLRHSFGVTPNSLGLPHFALSLMRWPPLSVLYLSLKYPSTL